MKNEPFNRFTGKHSNIPVHNIDEVLGVEWGQVLLAHALLVNVGVDGADVPVGVAQQHRLLQLLGQVTQLRPEYENNIEKS